MTTEPKPVTIEDIQKMLGAMMMEIEVLRRDNAALREQLAEKQGPVLVGKNESPVRP